MAHVTAAGLRTAAREAVLAAGGRGFVRFLTEGALMATDAVRRCADEAQRSALILSLEQAGFVCREQDGLLLLTPKDALIEGLTYDHIKETDWHDPMHPVRALGMRWIGKQKKALTPQGRQLIMETLRLCWQDAGQTLRGMEALRARAAVMQRHRDTSGMHEAGAVLLGWCDEMQGGHENEA